MGSQAYLWGGPTWRLTGLHSRSFGYPKVNGTNKERAIFFFFDNNKESALWRQREKQTGTFCHLTLLRWFNRIFLRFQLNPLSPRYLRTPFTNDHGDGRRVLELAGGRQRHGECYKTGAQGSPLLLASELTRLLRRTRPAGGGGHSSSARSRMDAPAPTRGPASFLTQANALLRKNLCFQVPLLPPLFPLALCCLSPDES